MCFTYESKARRLVAVVCMQPCQDALLSKEQLSSVISLLYASSKRGGCDITIIIVIIKSLLMEKILHLWVSLPAGVSQGILGTAPSEVRVWKISVSRAIQSEHLAPPLRPNRYWDNPALHVNAQNKGEGLSGAMGLGLDVLLPWRRGRC